MTNNKITEPELLVSVEDVSKKFSKDLKKSLRYGVSDIFKEILGIRKKPTLRKSEFWAVKNVSFKLRRGDCLGIIGHNGAGKSTLLKILNGLIKPDEGEIMIKGKIGALIELGAGFNPILTGRENVFNYGVILGFSHKEILSMYSDIVEFAEMKDFMETPVKNYSSGMKVRLGFAVAAQMKPDVLIIDEVMAVGDIGFKKKCFDKIGQMLQNTTVIFVSHAIPQVARLCNKVIVLDHGLLEVDTAEVSMGIEHYYKKFETGLAKNIGNKLNLNSIKHNGVDVLNSVASVEFGSDLELTLELEMKMQLDQYKIVLVFFDRNQNPVASFHSETYHVQSSNPEIRQICINRINFGTKRLSMNVQVLSVLDQSTELIQTVESACTIMTSNTPILGRAPILLSGN